MTPRTADRNGRRGTEGPGTTGTDASIEVSASASTDEFADEFSDESPGGSTGGPTGGPSGGSSGESIHEVTIDLTVDAAGGPVPRWHHDVPMDDEWRGTAVPAVVETRAMDLTELAVEVTAPPDADLDDVLPRRSIDIALDPPRFADADADADADAGTPSSAEEIDPRLRRRRDAVTATRRRRWMRRLGVGMALVLAGAAGVGLLHSPILDVDHIEIVGSTALSQAELTRETGLAVGDPIVFADPSRIAARLRKDPRFVRVAVNRRFPSTLSVRLTDRRQIAVVVGPTRALLVGTDGVVIAEARGDELVRHVTVTRDPATRVGRRLPAPMAAAVNVLGSLPFEIAVQVREMSITEPGELVFDLGDGTTVLFGTVDDAAAKLLAIRTMLGPSVDLRDLCRLDVRVPTAPTMRRHPACDPPAPAPPASAPPVSASPAAAPPTTADPAANPAATAAATDPSPSTSVPPSG